MSINIYISAVQSVQVNKTGKLKKVTHRFGTWQTPTDASVNIMKQANQIQAYKDWVVSTTEDEIEFGYTADGIWGKITSNRGKEHVAELDEWLDECKDFKITVTAC